MMTAFKEHGTQEKLTTVFLCALPVLVFMSKAAADGILALTGLIFLFFSFKSNNFGWLSNRWFQAVLLFVVFGMVTAVFSPYPKDAFVQSLIYIRWPLAAMALLMVFFNTPARLQTFEKAAFWFLAFVVADGILQMATGADILGHPSVEEHSRMTGPFAKRVLGVYGLKLFFFAFIFVLMQMERTKKNIIIQSVLILLFNVFLLMTGERIVFLLGFLFFLIWFGGVFVAYRELRKLIVTLVASAFSLFALVIALNHELFVKRFVPFVDAMKNFSDTTYGDIFHSAYQLWQLSPLVGVGSRMYTEVCVLKLGYPTDESLYQTVDGLCQHHPHNIYLELLSQNGILGTLIFFAVLFFVFRELMSRALWKKDMMQMTVLLSSVFVIFWPLASSMSIFANNYAGAVWLTIAWALARARILQAQPGAGGKA